MQALTFQGVEEVRHERVPDARLREAGDALVQVERAAICGSDLHVYHGREAGLDPGTVLGHEFIGRVAEVGRAVTRLKPGDRVMSPFTTSCGACFFCRRGLTARCGKGELFGWVAGGEGLHGGQAEAVRVPLADTTLVPIPSGLSDECALLLGDVLATGFHCASQGEVGPGSVVVVVGCGPVGLMAVAGAQEAGARRVLAVDRVPERLALAQRFGAEPVHGSQVDPRDVVAAATEGRGADAVLEAVGSPAAGRLAFELVRPGGVLSTAGVHTEPQLAFSPAEAYNKNLTYRVGRCPVRAAMERLLPVALSGRYPLAEVFSHRMALAAGPEGYRLFAARQDGCTKVLLTP